MVTISSALQSQPNAKPYGASEFDWDQYAALRPHYPDEIFDAIYAFHAEGSNVWDSVLDVACGPATGPTSLLARKFDSVTGYDQSAIQLDLARLAFADRPRMSFVIGSAEDLSPIPDESMDMVTCFTALHWIDAPKFLREAARVLKPGGTLAAGSYHTVGSSGHPKVDKVLRLLESKSLDAVLPTGEKESPVGRIFRETARSHYNNVAVPPELFTHETRWYWNLQEPVYYTQYSNLDAVDRRNTTSVGFRQHIVPLPSIDSAYSKQQFIALCDTLDHYDRRDSRSAADQIWDILGIDAKLHMSRPVEMVLCRRT